MTMGLESRRLSSVPPWLTRGAGAKRLTEPPRRGATRTPSERVAYKSLHHLLLDFRATGAKKRRAINNTAPTKRAVVWAPG